MAPSVSAACSAFTGDDRRWCLAFQGGVEAAGLQAEYASEAAFSTWLKSPQHLTRRGDDLYVLFFADDQPVMPLPQIDEDDKVILVVVPSSADKTIQELRLTVCSAADPVRVGGSAIVPGAIPKALKGDEPDYALRIVKGCSADGGLKAVLRQEGREESKDISVSTLPLHRFTIGLGLIYDFSRDVTYRAASVKGESVAVIVRDEARVGVAPPVPFVTFRFVPVDMRRTRRFSEMWGLSLGFSLVEPLDHLYPGILFEPLPGFGLVGGFHLQTEPTLAGGYKEGDRFSGGEVPVDERWAAPSVPLFVGLNVDAALFTRVLQALQ
ncbi:hypothetical protein [Chondromyces apiculatus]|uniref:hypothetical protein n=1 Tax=Chondromyces apiculatus TaxID=51 RepID=UPI0005C4C9E1|nr:hypothetical protein [Chondromyces apiculatus]